MLHTFRPFLLPTLLLAPLAAQDPVTLQPAGLGGKVDMVHHASQDQSIDAGGQQLEVHQEMWHHFSLRIDSVDALGVRRVSVTLRRLRGSIQAQTGENVEFDTAAPPGEAAAGDAAAMAAALREAMRGVIGAEYTAKIGKDGTMLQTSGLGEKLQQAAKQAKGLEQFIDGMLGDRTLSQLVRGAFGRLPKTPVKVGQTWQDTDDTGNTVPLQRLMQMTLRSVDADAADITFDGTITTKAVDGKQPATKIDNGKINGTLTVSRRDGFTLRAEAKSSMTMKSTHPQAGEVVADIQVVTTMERDTPEKDPKKAKETPAPGKESPAPAKESPAPPK